MDAAQAMLLSHQAGDSTALWGLGNKQQTQILPALQDLSQQLQLLLE